MKSNQRLKKIIKYMSCGSLFLASIVIADVPTNSNTFKGVEPGINRQKGTIDYLQDEQQNIHKASSSRKIFIQNFVVVGNTKLQKGEINAILLPHKNKKLNFQEIMKIVTEITNAYHKDGYILAKAYLAKGAYKNKILYISVIETKLDTIILKNTSLVNRRSIVSFLNPLKNKIVQRDSLERELLLINEEAGLNIKSVSIAAGKEVGSSDLLLNTEATSKVNGYIISDNYGSKYTGQYRLGIGGDINSLFGYGDKVSFSGLITDENNLKNGYISYSSFMGASGLKGTASYYETQYSLGGIYSSLDALGDSKVMKISLQYPIIKRRLETLDFLITPQYQKISDTQLGTTIDKRSKNLLIGVKYFRNFSVNNIESTLNANILYTTGRLSFVDKSLATPIEGNFNKIDIEVSLKNSIYDNVILTNSLKTQIALGNKILDPSQQITIGGAYGVRSYYNTQESGDNGYIYTFDLGYNIIKSTYSQQLNFFYDIGKAYSANSSISKIGFKALQDIGVGYSINYKKMFAKLQFATKIGNVTSVESPNINDSIMLLGQIGWHW